MGWALHFAVPKPPDEAEFVDVATRLLMVLFGILGWAVGVVLDININFLWQVAPEDIKSPEKASSELLPFFHKFVPADLDSVERFGIGLYNEEKKRASLDMYMDQASKEVQFFVVIQQGKFDSKKTILQIVDQIFEETDKDFLKANSSVLEIIG